ncbi:MAG: hypothetical protein JWN61_135 [Pseudonocardiales bacterium]|nr:hypothetical protein [Jatrophihabitantaceae bacterium]MCW2602000.1 hypothetical protein [Pseudonocardiales bacterium]
MPAEQLRQGDVFSVPGVVVRGPFRVLRAAAMPSMMRIAICEPDADTAYPLSAGQLKTARSLMLWRQVPVVVHERNRY